MEKGKLHNRKTSLPHGIDTLPSNFAETLLELEMEAELHCNIDTIKALVEQYSKAVEYYEAIKDPKYLYYNHRLQLFLISDDVLKTVKNVSQSGTESNTLKPLQQNKISSINQSFEDASDKVKAKVRKKARRLSMQYSSSLPSLRNTEKIIKSNENVLHKTSTMLHDNLHSQETSLELKIIARKESRTPRSSTKVIVWDNDENQDSNTEVFEKDLENVIEKYVTEKYKKVQEIKLKYQDQIQEIKDMKSNDITKQLLKEMNKQMEAEIAIAKEEADNQRSTAIRHLREVNR
ncbi:unnamed protein product [Blepharisma stoltei]|uniref:Uncharacterized protein n=1 Tax=Blepharisma stoltei TaxID=1481888 RepID=A0AAU9JHE1_9CILI|nr:unnamed protein product [Blepharisma stoltei]